MALAYWLTNWPISFFSILLPAVWLFIEMRRAPTSVAWKTAQPEDEVVFGNTAAGGAWSTNLALFLLAAGIITHTTIQALNVAETHGKTATEPLPLAIFLAPAGIVALIHLLTTRTLATTLVRIRANDLSVWVRLAVIFSLVWFLVNIDQGRTVFSQFFALAFPLRYGVMVILSLLSSITDNVALASMQGGLIRYHPLEVGQIRFLFLLLTWSGGFTSFGCLQSLALTSRLNFTMGEWFKAARVWALINVFYPTAVGIIK